MRYVAAYLLAQLGGSDNPSASDLEKILGSVGVDCDKERVQMVLKNLKGKSSDDLIAKGGEFLAAMPAGGGAAAAPAAAAAAAPADAPASKKKEEKKKEESDEEGDDMGFGLFD